MYKTILSATRSAAERLAAGPARATRPWAGGLPSWALHPEKTETPASKKEKKREKK